MGETVNRTRSGAPPAKASGEEDPAAMERRIFRSMCVAVVVSVILSALFAPWRVTTGLLLGGALSLFSQHWLRTSVAAVFDTTNAGSRPRLRVARYVLRYVIMAATVAFAYWLDVVSLAATLAGMCSFVAGALVEGFMQLYLALIRREET